MTRPRTCTLGGAIRGAMCCPAPRTIDGRLQSVTVKPDGTHSYTTSYEYGTTPITVTYPDGTTASGLETTITNPADANGVVGRTRVLYDSYGKVIRSIDPLGHTTLNEYDAEPQPGGGD